MAANKEVRYGETRGEDQELLSVGMKIINKTPRPEFLEPKD
jgi:hypothetical protein